MEIADRSKAEEIVNTLDLSYEDELTSEEYPVIEGKSSRTSVSRRHHRTGYPGYDTSIGWFNSLMLRSKITLEGR